MSDVTTYLLNYALDHHIGFELLNEVDSFWPSLAIPERNMMFINTNWYKQEELPMVVAHEIGHMIDGDSCYLYDQSTISRLKSENSANLIAINLLMKYCSDNDIEFNNSMTFLTQFNIPQRYENSVRKIIAG
ncbi:MAG TPA: ImmA/IrrE family metallo-endopeptidase [Companilactobacillus farciminis]|uniref:ImmA/IrrE family metallo-endopeptidase n=1 Tax=Companilactobacillus farciminis TaxID=1612 RepID=A0A921HTB3_9LACO|nr:ImmA/IrrE family metallo-endopeptidase [Companilactobacillus pabuli]MDG5113494.1 ImmA/IrrE family metallo-endopeptidase [Companilactobacillus pabuli]HJF87318.1 ImmA/IrrE family metallo-endopeptidase [Companilactobacillus farciminis]